MFQILINEKAYDMEFAENKTSADIIQMLPLKLSMQAYLDIEYYAELPERPFFDEKATVMQAKEKALIQYMGKKILVVCYSFSNGNTRMIAKQLQQALGADYTEIETVTPYPAYGGFNSKVVSQGQREVDEGFQPEIKPLSVNVADYDVVAIGTPTWWYTMAPAVLTFLNANDWSQKTVIPFMTHGGWPGHVIKDIQNGCVGAKFLPDMKIQFDSQGGSNMLTSQADINAWIERVTKAI